MENLFRKSLWQAIDDDDLEGLSAAITSKNIAEGFPDGTLETVVLNRRAH
jgi:hypothetical protein